MPPRARTEPDPAAANDTTTGESQGATGTLAVGHPYNELVLHDADGKPTGLVITSDGTEVSVDDEETVRAVAKDAGVPIRKVR